VGCRINLKCSIIGWMANRILQRVFLNPKPVYPHCDMEGYQESKLHYHAGAIYRFFNRGILPICWRLIHTKFVSPVMLENLVPPHPGVEALSFQIHADLINISDSSRNCPNVKKNTINWVIFNVATWSSGDQVATFGMECDFSLRMTPSWH